MNLKEHEGRALLTKYGIPVPRGFLVSSGGAAAVNAAGGDFADRINEDLKKFAGIAPEVKRFALKAQLKTGKRGKSGGIIFADAAQVAEKANELFGKVIRDEKVEEILVVEALEVGREFYLSIALDRFERCPVIMISTAGGIDIEETAAEAPEKIGKLFLRDPEVFTEKEMNGLLLAFGISGQAAEDFSEIARRLLELFNKDDCLLAEINPLILTTEKKLVAVDAKIVIDDNSIFRHPKNLEILRRGFSRLESEANASGLSYVELDGELAIIGNGAGLVMATLDAVKYFGAKPANFCDAGGGASKEMIEKAMKIVLQKKSARAVFINIFGGITRCDLVAEGITGYLKKNKISLPMVVRMVGTNEKTGKKILNDAGISTYSGFEEAAREASKLTAR